MDAKPVDFEKCCAAFRRLDETVTVSLTPYGKAVRRLGESLDHLQVAPPATEQELLRLLARLRSLCIDEHLVAPVIDEATALLRERGMLD